MKRLFAFLLALCLVLGLASCGGKKDGFSLDLAAFYDEVTGEDFPMMMELSDEMVEGIYPGLGAIERKQSVLYSAAVSFTPCEIAMVEVADAKDVEAVQAIFQKRIDDQVAGGAWYPESIEGWKNGSEIVTRDNYVCLFVTPEDLPSPAEAFKGK